MPKKSFLLHIPKTAGHSINSAVGWAYPPERKLLAIGDFGPGTITKQDALATPYDDWVANVDYSSGHLFFGEIDRWSAGRIFSDYLVYTVIREPLERALSAYAYLREKFQTGEIGEWLPDGRPTHAKRISEMGSLSVFLRSRPFHSELVISQCMAVSGSDDFAVAIESLRKRFIGFPTIEYLAEFYERFHARLGGPKASVGWINRSDSRHLIEHLTPDDIAAFYKDCSDELKLYQWAKVNWRDHLTAAMDARMPATPVQAPAA